MSDTLDNKVIMAYWASWSVYRDKKGSFDISKVVDPSLFTHFVWAFFRALEDGQFEYQDKGLVREIDKVRALKIKNPKLKTLVSVGGWEQGSKIFSDIAADAKKRKKFATTTMEFLNKHGFDGLNLSWLYPAQRDGDAQDVDNFVILLQEVKEVFRSHNLLLTIAVAPVEYSARISYDIPKIVKHVDLINALTYDFAVPQQNVVCFNSPLRGDGQNTVQAAIEYWLSQGAPADKLLMDISFYGNTFTLADKTKTRPGAPSTGPGYAGPYIKEEGKLGYNEIYENLISGWKREWDEKDLAPYAYKDNQWCSYDDAQSIGEKMKFVKSKNLRGVGVWTLDADDFLGGSGEKYPLLRSVIRGLK